MRAPGFKSPWRMSLCRPLAISRETAILAPKTMNQSRMFADGAFLHAWPVQVVGNYEAHAWCGLHRINCIASWPRSFSGQGRFAWSKWELSTALLLFRAQAARRMRSRTATTRVCARGSVTQAEVRSTWTCVSDTTPLGHWRMQHVLVLRRPCAAPSPKGHRVGYSLT